MQKMEIITRTERRRKFSDTFRRQVVAETEQPGVTIISVAGKYDLALSLVYKWREKYLDRRGSIEHQAGQIPQGTYLPMNAVSPADDFIYAGQVADNGHLRPSYDEHQRERADRDRRIEISLPNGIVLRVGDHFNENMLAKVMRIAGSGI